ncbi:MAG: hypothetical protein CMM64_01495 [Rhodospirillaceae bacterium]|nr:hypothetical protein [Rhodospirillaceae bacterium]
MNSYNLDIPIFPLDNVIILPGSFLPLNIFEKRYLNMVDDALKTSSRLIGLIQPLMNKKENIESFENSIGCYGRIIKFEETENETYIISLKGLSRFRVINTQLIKRGYLSSKVSVETYKNDINKLKTNNFKFINDKSLKTILKSYLKLKKLDSNWNYINSCSNLDLTNQLSMICPFSTHEKQMLLESKSIDDRYILLLSILENTVKLNEKENQIRH